MTRTWRRGGVAVCVVVGVLLTAACGDDGSGDGGGGGGEIAWWHVQPENSPVSALWDEFATEFNTDNPDGAQVDPTFYENDAFKSNLTTSIQGGAPPDIFQSWGGGVLAQQVEAGMVRDLTDELADVIDQISPGALQPYTIDGRAYGLPWNMGMVGFWYNEELFEQAGITEPPATWSEFLDTVQRLKDAGITPIALGGADLWPGHYWWSYLALRQAGLGAFQEVHETQSLDHQGFVRAGELLQDLVELEPFQEGFLAAGFENADGEAQLMGNGDAAMELMGQWAPQAAIDNAGLDEEAAEAHLERLGWFRFPAVEGGAGAITDTFGGGDGFAVGANAPDEVFDFLRHVFDSYQRLVEVDNGLIPTVEGSTSGITNENRLEIVDTVASSTGFQLYLDQDFPPAVGAQVNESVGALIAGQATPQEVVDSINEVFANAN